MTLLDRTFHPDEANQAFTTGHLLETGAYAYQPQDHHGPTLYYAAAALQKAAGNETTAALDGSLLRATPLLFAILALVVGALAIKKWTHNIYAALAWVLLLSTSPIFVFFATDFIQEMLLACFLIGMFAAAAFRHPWWFGLSAGLAFATKETSILSFAAAGGAYLIAVHHKPNWNKCILAILVAFLTSITLYSSFCSNWIGVWNAFVEAPLSYLHRAAGDANSIGAAWHIHPWNQYFSWLFTAPYSHWGLLALMMAAYLAYRMKRGHAPYVKFAFAYAVLLTALYALIPYKTPWCALQLIVAYALTAVLGFGAISKCASPLSTGLFALGVFLTIGLEQIPAVIRLNQNPDEHTIPYNYAGASPEVKDLSAQVCKILDTANEEDFVAVAIPPADTWPIPWYVRKEHNRIGYWPDFESFCDDAKTQKLKPICLVVPAEVGHLVQPQFPHLKNTRRYHVRPGVRLRIFYP